MVKYVYAIGGKEVSEAEYHAVTKKHELKLKRGGYDPTNRRKRKPTEFDSVMAAHDERYRKWYKEPPPPVIEDYRSKEAAKTWPGYQRIKTPQGWKEGPARFKDRAEQSLYEKTYGFRQETGKRMERK